MAPDLEIELAPLRTLVAIAHHGTVTEAARRLHLSQPAATHQMRQLERQLGVALFDRVGRHLVLTEAGRATVARARRILGEVAGLGEELTALSGLSAGQIRLGGGATATVHLLPRLIASFRATHPGIHFYVREGSSGPILGAVAEGDLDLAIAMLPCDRPGLVVEALWTEPIHFFGWPGAPLTGTPFPPERLNGEPFIHAGADTPLRNTVEHGLEAAGVTPRVVMELQSIEAIKAHVELGLGYSALGAFALEREVAEGRLVLLQPRRIRLERRLGLVHRGGATLSPAVLAFIRHLRDQVKGEPR
jgi:DNA-binding transcriptional LysR family regulator